MTVSELLYLEPDDEITGVVRRLRQTDAARVVLVAPGRSKATSSVVALRLLARLAADEKREIALVADAATRSLAAEAGVVGFASVAEAQAGVVPPKVAPQRATINVVRGSDTTTGWTRPARRARSSEETAAVRVPASTPAARAGPRRRTIPVAVAVLALLLLGGAAVAAAVLLPAATVAVTPAARSIGPLPYEIDAGVPQRDEGQLTESASGTAGGTRLDQTAATGTVVFLNFNTGPVEVLGQTRLGAGNVVFFTDAPLVVPVGKLTPEGVIQAGEGSVTVTAEGPGAGGNLPADAINVILDERTASSLRGFPDNTERLVGNPAATAGGSETSVPIVQQADVDAVVTQITDALQVRLAGELVESPDRIYAPPGEPPQPVVPVPEGLVGREGEPSFELTGTLDWERRYVEKADVERVARDRFADDDGRIPKGTSLIRESVVVEIGAARLDGERLRVEVTISAQAAPNLDAAAIRQQVAGMDADAARAVLDDLGAVSIDLWPGWVTQVPELDWRIDVRLEPLRQETP